MPIHECRARVKAGLEPELDTFLSESEESSWMLLEDPIAGSAVLVGYFESEDEAGRAWSDLRGRVDDFLEAGPPVFSRLADQDWKLSYREHFKAWRSGPVHWVPVWEKDTYQLPPGEVALWLDPGMAFGTGNHETTRLCLQRMTDLVAEWRAVGRTLESVGVIDAGCGSGILALSAAALGLGPVRGFDLDPESVVISRENAVLNSLADKVIFEQADLRSGLAGRQASLVLANILANVLVEEKDALLASVVPGGTLVLSGILATELAAVRAAFAGAAPGFGVSSRTMGEWADLALVRGS